MSLNALLMGTIWAQSQLLLNEFVRPDQNGLGDREADHNPTTSRGQRPHRNQELVVGRELVHPGQAFLGTLDVRPADNPIPVHQELSSELDLVPLKFCVLALGHLEAIQPVHGVSGLAFRHLELQLACEITVGRQNSLPDLRRHWTLRYPICMVRDEVGVSTYRAAYGAKAEEKARSLRLRGYDRQRLDSDILKFLGCRP